MLIFFFFNEGASSYDVKERSTNEKDARLRRGGSLQIRFDCASKRPLQQLRTYHKQRGPFMARDHPTYIFLVIWHLTSEILLLSIDNFQEFGIIKASSYTRLIIVSQWYVCIFNSVFSYNYLFSILSLMILHVIIIIIIFLNYFLIRNVVIVVNVLIQIAMILKIEMEANFFIIHILSNKIFLYPIFIHNKSTRNCSYFVPSPNRKNVDYPAERSNTVRD